MLINDTFKTAAPALRVVTGSKGETLVLDKPHNDSEQGLIWKNLKQFADKATVPESVMCRRQINKLTKKSSMFSVNKTI